LRLGQFSQLQRSDAGRAFDVQQHEAERAQLEAAKWDLDRTTVRAPANGYVTNLALRKGARVNTQSPVMAFIDTSDTVFGAEIPQIYARYIEAGGEGEKGWVYTTRSGAYRVDYLSSPRHDARRRTPCSP
jgi:multidrug resistance efflux pump